MLRITRRRILIVIAIFVAIGCARYIKEEEYIRVDLNVAILQKIYIPLPAYSCNIIIATTDQNNVTNTQEKKLLKSDCSEVVKKGILHIGGHTCYNITRNATSYCSFIEKEENVSENINISISLREVAIKYDLISGRVILPSWYKDCYYQSFICYDLLDSITVFWDTYEDHPGDGVSFLYYGLAELYTSKTIPDRKSIVIRDSSGSILLHLRNNNFTLYEKVVITETNEETLLISFDKEETLIDLMNSLSKKTGPLEALTFKEIDVHEELERYWKSESVSEVRIVQNQNKNSLNEGTELTPVMKKEIEISAQTTTNRVEENISDIISDQQIIANIVEQNITISDQQTIPNRDEQHISKTISDHEPNEPRDNFDRTKTKDNASMYIVVPCILISIILIIAVFFIRIRQRHQVEPEERNNMLDAENEN